MLICNACMFVCIPLSPSPSIKRQVYAGTSSSSTIHEDKEGRKAQLLYL